MKNVMNILDLNKYSERNLQKIGRVLGIIINQIELEGWNRLLSLIKIPLKTLERERFSYEETTAIIKAINQIDRSKIIEIINEEVYSFSEENDFLAETDDELEKRYRELMKKKKFKTWSTSKGVLMEISEKDLDNYVILKIKSLKRLEKIKNDIDKKLKEKAKTYTKETRRQLEELGEKQAEVIKKIEGQIKPLKKLEKQISLVAHSSSIRNYEEVFKKISEQLTPIKDALEKVNKIQLTTEYAKNYLTPVLQRLVAPVKQIEEQMKRLNKAYGSIKIPDSPPLGYDSSKLITSPEIIRAKQESQTQTMREIKNLIQELLSEKAKKNITKEGRNEIPWYKQWWMVCLVYPIIVVIITLIVSRFLE